MTDINQRTEEAWRSFKCSHRALFDSMRETFKHPALVDSIHDFAKAAFYAGANYEYAHLHGLGEEVEVRT